MKKFLIAALLIIAVNELFAQGYTQALGIRAGWISPGVEYRYYRSESHSLKALLSVRNRGVQLTGFTEFYQYDLFPFSYQLVFVYGAGIHAGFESWDDVTFENNQRINNVRSAFITGLDGLIALEYIFYEAPVKVGIEAKPFFDVFGKNGFDVVLPDIAFTVKYLF